MAADVGCVPVSGSISARFILSCVGGGFVLLWCVSSLYRMNIPQCIHSIVAEQLSCFRCLASAVMEIIVQ